MKVFLNLFCTSLSDLAPPSSVSIIPEFRGKHSWDEIVVVRGSFCDAGLAFVGPCFNVARALALRDGDWPINVFRRASFCMQTWYCSRSSAASVSAAALTKFVHVSWDIDS